MPKITLTTMVMIQDPATGQVLVQDRLLRWKGLAFPGGHVDPGESIYACAVREVLEETGLAVRDLLSCGTLHYSWHETPESEERRYFVFLYRTSNFSGELIEEMEEGRHFWIALEDLLQQKKRSCPNFENYFPVFFGEHSEAFMREESEFVYY
jgi:8-oxo-dGTP diphosphatase